MKKFKSGAQKRQEAAKRKLALAGSSKSQAKLKFGEPRVPDQCNVTGEVEKQASASTDEELGVIFNKNEQTKQGVTFDEDQLQENDEEEKQSAARGLSASDSESESETATACSSRSDRPAACDAVLFVPPKSDSSLFVKNSFLQQHPIQKTTSSFPFDSSRAFFTPNGKVPRNWLSYCEATQSLYCTTCMCFDVRSTSTFVSGFKVTGRKDIYDQISRHELCSAHRQANVSCLASMAQNDVGTMIDRDLASLKARDRARCRSVVERIIDVCIFVGTQAIAYRGRRGESISTLRDQSVNHGNFLELCQLLSKYDPVLQAHIHQCIEDSKHQKTSKGRGQLLTFVSKTSVNKLVRIIGSEIQSIIANEVRDAGIFSTLVDSTKDVSSLDQLAIAVRIVRGRGAEEKLLTFVVSHDGTGLGLYNKIVEELSKHGLNPQKIVACSFDGASNMSGIFKGLQARLKDDNPDLVFTHCAAHCLNLVLTGCSESCNSVKSMFGLVQAGAVFISDSYKRSDCWSKVVKERNSNQGKLRRLGKIGKTRWWSKPNALQSVVDRAGDNTSKLVDFLLCMQEIKSSTFFDSSSVFTAESLQSSWCRFETILLARVMLDIFDRATPVSKGLQSVQVDYLLTFEMIQSLLKKVESMRDRFEFSVESTREYVKHINKQLEQAECRDINIPENFSPIRGARNATRCNISSAGSSDCETMEAADHFRINTFIILIDYVTQGLRDRFNPNKDLLKDISLLDPKRFSSDASTGSGYSTYKDGELATIASMAKVNANEARTELIDFCDSYLSLFPSSCPPKIQNQLNSPSDVHNDEDDVLSDDDDAEDYGDKVESDLQNKVKCEACGHCIACAFKAFVQTPMLQSSFPTIYTLYTFILTLPTTQVPCERVFSKLKVIKTRLRAALSQNLLEPLIMMNVNREIALTLDRQKIINDFASSSTVLSRHLT